MSFGSHQDRGIGDAVCQFGDSVAGTGENYQKIQQAFGTDGFCLIDGCHWFNSGDTSGFGYKILCLSEAAVNGLRGIGEDGLDFGACI